MLAAGRKVGIIQKHTNLDAQYNLSSFLFPVTQLYRVMHFCFSSGGEAKGTFCLSRGKIQSLLL